MIQKMGRYILILMAFSLILGGTYGCGSKEEKAKTQKTVLAPGPAGATGTVNGSTVIQPSVTENKADDAGLAVEVDGVKMTKRQLNEELAKRMSQIKEQIPADQLERAKAEIRKNIIDEFVVRNLLSREVTAKKVTATEEEIKTVINEMKSELPPGVTMEEFMKNNQIDTAKMNDNIAMSLKIKKLVEKEIGGRGIKITDKEIADFYEKNKDKFKKPETVHARHILVSKAPQDKEKDLKAKKVKAENLRKKLLEGADFADIATKNSDCPSKQAGGDLGTFARGRMVKPFEDAAFSQKKNEIGPVVETDFGFHIIQVIDHQASQIVKLDKETKQRINAHLESQKWRGALDGILKRLKASANIVVDGT